MTALPKRLTLEQFLKLPEAEPALEFEDGAVLQKVSPKAKHSVLQFKVAERCNRPRGPGKFVFAFPELRATYAGRSYVPDLSVYQLERIPLDELGRPVDDFFEPPDITIEIVSPEQRSNALIRRCLWYVSNGVRIAVLVDPNDEPILVFRPGEVPQAATGDEKISFAEVIPDFALTPKEIFRLLRLG